MEYDYQYDSAHKWLYYHHGKPTHCEMADCSGKSKRLEYVLRRGCEYNKNRNNYIMMCKSCHVIYDGVIERLTRLKLKPVMARPKDDPITGIWYDSAKAASQETGVSQTAINNNLKGRSSSAGGYSWTYA